MGSKARESAKAMSLAFVLLDFHLGASEEERSVRDGGEMDGRGEREKETARSDCLFTIT